MIAWRYDRSVTRRDWIAGALAVMGAARLQAARITKGRVSAITDELGYNQEDAIAAAKQFGLQWVDLRNIPGSDLEFASLPEAEHREYAAQLGANKLKVSVLHIGPKSDLAQAIKAANILGAGAVRVHSGARAADPAKELPALGQKLNALAPMAEMARVRLLIANRATENIGTSAESKAILDLVASKWVGLDWVPGEASKLSETPWPDGYRQLPKGRILRTTAETVDFSNGPSSLNWRIILEGLQRDGFQGEIGLETGNTGGTFQKTEEPLRNLLHIVGEL